MSKQAFIVQKFAPSTRLIINRAEVICDDYARQGYGLTLRQLYYQFVSRGYIANKQSEYDRLGTIINDARLAGLINWKHLEDRTRNLASTLHFVDPADRIEFSSRAYQIDKWERQENYVEVWVEKEALAGVVEQAARRLDVPHFACRGYVSQSEMWSAGQRLKEKAEEGKHPVIIHLGDHDPSGIDMTRDNEDRLAMFMTDGLSDGDNEDMKAMISDVKESFTVDRIALNMDQIQQYNPPPNPAKITDSRASAYIEKYGGSSWELDALSPAQLDALITDAIRGYMDTTLFDQDLEREKTERAQLVEVSNRWEEIVEFMGNQS